MTSLKTGGYCTVFIVSALFMTGSILLFAFEQHQRQQRMLLEGEMTQIKRFTEAQSALAWGSQCVWQEAGYGWQCQHDTESGAMACLSIQPDGSALLAGISGFEKGQMRQRVWQRGVLSTQRFIPKRHGWLDFCPLQERYQCDIPFL